MKGDRCGWRRFLCGWHLEKRDALIGVFILFAIGFVGGCAHTRKFGDAVYREPYGPQLGLTTSCLTFPPVSLGTVGETTVRVRSLARSTYPEDLRIPVPPSENLEGRVDQPWRSCQFSVTLRCADDGRLIHQEKYDLHDYVTAGSRRYKSAMDGFVYLQLGKRGADGVLVRDSKISVVDYDIVVKVDVPSRRKGDKLKIVSVFGPQWMN